MDMFGMMNDMIGNMVRSFFQYLLLGLTPVVGYRAGCSGTVLSCFIRSERRDLRG